MPTVVLGNTAPCQAVYPDEKAAKEGRFERVRLKHLEQSETTFTIPPSDPPGEALLTVTRTYDAVHSEEPPAWVESDSAALGELLAAHYGIRVGRPKGWKVQGG